MISNSGMPVKRLDCKMKIPGHFLQNAMAEHFVFCILQQFIEDMQWKIRQ